MILPGIELIGRLAPQGICLNEQCGDVEFAGDATVFRRRLLVDEAAVDAEISLVCLRFRTAPEVASFAAGHLAEQGIAPLFLKPAAMWESQLTGPTRPAWEAALDVIGMPIDEPALTGDAAIELISGQTALPRLFETLMSLRNRADALFLSDAPLVVTVTTAGQVWFTSKAPTLLPTIEVPVG